MKPTKETEKKLLALCGVLPVLADFIEDLNMEHVFTKNRYSDSIQTMGKRKF